MVLKNVKPKADLAPVLMDNKTGGPDPAYFLLSGVSTEKWENMTILVNGNYGDEFNKTFGHYHPSNAARETYQLVYGNGIFVIQSKFIEDGKWSRNKVSEVIFIRPEAGDEIVITPKFGHSWSNIGNSPLLIVDDWRSGHTPDDYVAISEQKGMAYYLLKDKNSYKYIPNPNYVDLPKPTFMTAKEFAKYQV